MGHRKDSVVKFIISVLIGVSLLLFTALPFFLFGLVMYYSPLATGTIVLIFGLAMLGAIADG